jgi:hypothetical protein
MTDDRCPQTSSSIFRFSRSIFNARPPSEIHCLSESEAERRRLEEERLKLKAEMAARKPEEEGEKHERNTAEEIDPSTVHSETFELKCPPIKTTIFATQQSQIRAATNRCGRGSR